MKGGGGYFFFLPYSILDREGGREGGFKSAWKCAYVIYEWPSSPRELQRWTWDQKHFSGFVVLPRVSWGQYLKKVSGRSISLRTVSSYLLSHSLALVHLIPSSGWSDIMQFYYFSTRNGSKQKKSLSIFLVAIVDFDPFWVTWGIFGRFITTHFGTVSALSKFPLIFFYKK